MATATYNTLTDEQLCEIYTNTQDDLAFREIYDRYNLRIEKMARNASLRSGGQLFDEFYSYGLQMLEKAARTFDISRQTFKKYLSVKLKSVFATVVRSQKYASITYYDEEGKKKYHRVQRSSVSLDASSIGSGAENSKIFDKSDREKTTYKYQQSVESTDFLEFLHGENETLAKVAVLVERGYSYEEVAILVGRTAKGSTLRTWTTRQVQKIRDLYFEYCFYHGINPTRFLK